MFEYVLSGVIATLPVSIVAYLWFSGRETNEDTPPVKGILSKDVPTTKGRTRTDGFVTRGSVEKSFVHEGTKLSKNGFNDLKIKPKKGGIGMRFRKIKVSQKRIEEAVAKLTQDNENLTKKIDSVLDQHCSFMSETLQQQSCLKSEQSEISSMVQSLRIDNSVITEKVGNFEKSLIELIEKVSLISDKVDDIQPKPYKPEPVPGLYDETPTECLLTQPEIGRRLSGRKYAVLSKVCQSGSGRISDSVMDAAETERQRFESFMGCDLIAN